MRWGKKYLWKNEYFWGDEYQLCKIYTNHIIIANNQMTDTQVRQYELSLNSYQNNNHSIFCQFSSQSDTFRLNQESKDYPIYRNRSHCKKYLQQKTTKQSIYDQIVHQYHFINYPQENEEYTNSHKQHSSLIQYKNKNIIQVSISTIMIKSKIDKGDRFQTKNLSKNLHTETAKQLKSRAILHQFNREEIDVIRQFCNSNKSIDSFKCLLKDKKINQRVRSFYQSKYFIQEILRSKMEMRTKLAMIKYLEKIRSLTYDKHFKAWKKDSNDF